MDNLDIRLARCFQAVFPDLDSQGVRSATPATVKAWDSVASVTLLTVVEEEFGLPIEVEDLDQFTSFESLRNYLQKRTQAGEAGTGEYFHESGR